MNHIWCLLSIGFLSALPWTVSADPCAKAVSSNKTAMAELAKTDSNPAKAKALAKAAQKALSDCQKEHLAQNKRAKKAIKTLESKDGSTATKSSKNGLSPDQDKKAKAAQRASDTAKKNADSLCKDAQKALSDRDKATASWVKANEMVAEQRSGWTNWVSVAGQLEKRVVTSQSTLKAALTKCSDALADYAKKDAAWEAIYGR